VAAHPVLALDELFVTDVADAAILARLFAGLWAGGLVLVARSNRAPADLYKGGLQRDLFLPFIAALESHARPLDLASAVDYRRLAHAARGLYFCPPDWPTPEAGSAELRARFAEVAAAPGCHPPVAGDGGGGGGEAGFGDGQAPPPAPATVPVMMGRTLAVPLASGAAAFFPFQALCGAALGAADYIALSRAYHTLALDGVPVFTASTAPAAARFVTVVDVLYEHRVRTFMSAAGPPSALFSNVMSRAAAAAAAGPAGRGLPVGAWVDDNLAFAVERTISRLTEMQTLTYLVAHARAHAPVLLLALEEQVARVGSVPERRNAAPVSRLTR
jgi:predicted ATPase